MFFIGCIIVLTVIFKLFGGSVFFRLLWATIWAPICGYGLYYSGIFLWAVVMGIYDTSAYYAKHYDTFHRLMTWDGLHSPIAIVFIIFFFIGFLNPRLYGH